MSGTPSGVDPAGGPYEVILLVVAAGVATAVVLGAVRRRRAPGAAFLALTMAAIVAWTGGYALELTVTTARQAALWRTVQWVGVAVLPTALLGFTATYAGYEEYITFRTGLVAGIEPAVTVLLLLTNDAHGLLWTASIAGHPAGALSVASAHHGPWVLVHLVYASVLFVAAAWLLVRLRRRHAWMRGQASLLLVAFLLPLTSELLAYGGLNPVDVELTPVAFLAMGLIVGAVLYRGPLFETLPVAPGDPERAVFAHLGSAVFVLDSNDTVVRYNDEGASLLDADDAEGEPAAAVLPDAVVDAIPSDPTDEEVARCTLPVDEATAAWRHVRVRTRPLTRGQELYSGRIVTAVDVTDEHLKTQRISVLNRVLRHNVRNDMNVVVGQAQAVRDDVDGDAADRLDAVVGKARRLVKWSERARDLERVLRDGAATEECDLAALFRADGVDLDDRSPDVTVEIDVPEHCVVRGPGTLRQVPVELIENCAEHADAEELTVRITVDRSDGLVTATVEDDGVGFTDGQRDVLDRPAEGALEHGPGLGLWFVQWTMQQVGGSVDLRESDLGGAAVDLTFPASAVVEWAEAS